MVDVGLVLGLIVTIIGVMNLSKVNNGEPLVQFVTGNILIAVCLALGDRSEVIKTFAQWILR